MSEQVYLQVERAIRERLYCALGNTYSGRPAWRRPVRIEHGNIVMLWGDCGREDNPDDLVVWTTDQWAEAVGVDGVGLHRLVGMWDFVQSDDPAAGAIRYCHHHPDAAGRELHRLRELLAAT